MDETTLLEMLRELGAEQQKVEQALEQYSQQRLLLAGRVSMLVDLLGGPDKVKALLEQTETK